MKDSKKLYIAEATLEYLIALLVEGSYLSRLTMAIGLSDSVTGIIHSVISLGNLFGLFSMLITKRSVKKFVIGMSVANQLMFMLLYVIPLTGNAIPSAVKTTAFVILIIGAYIIYYIAHPKKINMLMSAVADGERGRFTANKEIVSLITGIAFTFGMGKTVDFFVGKGQLNYAFIVCGVMIFLSSVFHTVSLFLFPENKAEAPKKSPIALKEITSLLKDKSVIAITVLFTLWYFALRCSGSFFGTYELKELKFTQTFISLLTATASVSRILFSRIWGKYADKHSFSSLLRICFIFAAAGYVFTAFATPANGKFCFICYNILHGIAMAGINSSVINLVFDLVETQKRSNALALTQAVAGTIGFLAVLAVSPIVDYIQSCGNMLFGVKIYAQQVLSAISVVFTLASLLYVKFVLLKLKRVEK